MFGADKELSEFKIENVTYTPLNLKHSSVYIGVKHKSKSAQMQNIQKKICLL